MSFAYKLGKHMPRSDRRTLMLGSYMNITQLPPIPDTQYWQKDLKSWGMMKNDLLGDCAIATPGHMVMGWTLNATGKPIIIPDDQIVAAYSNVSGYNPQDGSTDNGCQVLDVLNYWRQRGVGGHNIVVYAGVKPKLITQVKAAVYLFGGLYLGFALPAMLETLKMMDRDWVLPAQLPTDGSEEPYSLGGHAVPIIGYDPTWVYIITWGAIRRVSWPFFKMYCDEGFACISKDWIKPSGVTPSGLNMDAMLRDVQAVSR